MSRSSSCLIVASMTSERLAEGVAEATFVDDGGTQFVEVVEFLVLRLR